MKVATFREKQMNSIIQNIYAFIRIVRVPNLLIIVLAQYFTAIFILGDSQNWLNFVFDLHLFLISLSTVLIAAAGYIINDYFDIKIDYINKPQRVIVGKEIRRRHAMAAHTILNVTAVVIGLIVSPLIALVNAFSATLLWWYSNSLKKKPLVGNIVVAFLTALCLVVLALYYRHNELFVMMYAVFAFGLTLIREIIKDMEDVKGDADFGRKTLPIVYGIRKTKIMLLILSIGFVLALFMIALKLNNHHIFMYFGVFLLTMIFFIWKMLVSDTIKDFAFLSLYCKFLMIFGILSMVFF